MRKRMCFYVIRKPVSLALLKHHWTGPQKLHQVMRPLAFRPWGPGSLVFFAGEEYKACREQTLAQEAMRLMCVHGGL